ncbi:hypothetical protein AGMMS49942_24120 [Spirochaetia bacterium]|nr:hypothetical protein AGMMS49942_24120 [Spirochaetia bacterium]
MSTDYTPNAGNAPAAIPKAEIDRSFVHRLVVHYRDKGSDIYGIEFRWAVLDRPPAGIDDLVHIVFDPLSPCIFDFDESQRGKTCYFAMRWENSHGIKGPWSGIYSAIIP